MVDTAITQTRFHWLRSPRQLIVLWDQKIREGNANDFNASRRHALVVARVTHLIADAKAERYR